MERSNFRDRAGERHCANRRNVFGIQHLNISRGFHFGFTKMVVSFCDSLWKLVAIWQLSSRSIT